MALRLPKGITLLEMVLYIGLFMIVVPSFTLFIVHIWQQETGFDARIRLEQTAALIFLEATQSITEADAITLSTSNLGTDASTLRFTDANGSAVVLDTSLESIDFNGTTQSVRRLRLQRGGNPAVWLTDPEQQVTQWRIDAVRNSAGTLTGLRFQFDAELLNKTSNISRNATFAADTVIALSPHTIEQ